MSLSAFVEVQIPVSGGHIAGRWYGDHMTRPILALHGWMDNCGSYAKLAPLLTPYASVLCIDLPGHGYSSHLPLGTVYHSLEFVRTVMRVMQAYKWHKVSLIAHSLMGSVAFQFAALYPERVDLLITLDIIISVPRPTKMAFQAFQFIIENALAGNDRLWVDSMSQSLTEPPCYSFLECEQLLHKGSMKSVSLENCKYILERNLTKSQKYPHKYYFSRDGRLKYLYEFRPPVDFCEQLGLRFSKVPIPYMVIKGGASTTPASQSTDMVDFFVKNNPFFELHLIPDGTHHLHLNDADKVAELIVPFLKKHRPIEVIREENNKKLHKSAKL